jgi:RimJ/RimL family protein N-acetyltransferase
MSPEPWVRPVTLEGRRIRLEPLSADHLDDLARVAFDASIWRWTIARPIDDAGLRAWLDTALEHAAEGSEVPFASVDRSSGRAVGSTRYLSIVPEHRRLEIGWTWLGGDFQRTGLNREAKLLQLGHAFEALEALRVEFKTHASNDRSRTALLGIGTTFEGVFRRHMIMPDGSRRDSAYYSVIVDEWPAVKARLLAGLGDAGPALPSSVPGGAQPPTSVREDLR